MDSAAHVQPWPRSAASVLLRRGQDTALAEAWRRVGVAMPEVGAFTVAGGLTVVRTAPHQMLALRDGEGVEVVKELEAALEGAAGVVDQSDARATFRVSGPGAGEALMRLVPVDLHPSAMRPGRAAQTIGAHLAVLVCQIDDVTYEVSCGRSFGGSLQRAIELTGTVPLM